MIEVSKTFLRPDTGLKFLASDQLTPVLQEEVQQSEGLILEFDAAPRLTDLSGMEIGLKSPKPNCLLPVMHRKLSLSHGSLASLASFARSAVTANWFPDVSGE